MRLILLIITALVFMTLTAGYLAMVDVFDPIGFKGIFAATMGLMFFGTGLLWVFYVERDKLVAALKMTAQTHAVSDLMNSRPFLKILSEQLTEARRNSKPYGVLLVGPDMFREINNRMGHTGGDIVLKHIGERIKYVVNDKGLVAHYSGDMFIAGIVDADIETLKKMAENLREILVSAPYKTKGVSAQLKVSISCASAPPSEYDSEELLFCLVNRLHQAKSMGGNKIITSDS
jgi:diguanylate cyclase (GGDEF)-like protein